MSSEATLERDGTGTAELAVRADGLSKRYLLGEHASLRNTLNVALRRPSAARPIDALSDVSFSVQRGCVFGIVGPNGSGKSTALTILAGITLPSAGSVSVRGRVLPMLAVGAGFHPELTGRENVALFGAILGLPSEAVAARTDQIFEFAEVADHVETPVKRYSDGMRARLSFGIAMQFPADVYVFDEVFAVVDGEFRDRCLGMIRSLVADGRCVLVTSHDHSQIRELCDRVMWLEQGRVRAIGHCDQVMDEYVSVHH
jgi:ABC-type polysaccharide/polyol phosphate transport system ATPase subunit